MANTGMIGMSTGRVTKLLREKGFGFLRGDEAGTEYFFHRSSVLDAGFEKLSEGQAVRFMCANAPKGPRAEDVSPILQQRMGDLPPDWREAALRDKETE